MCGITGGWWQKPSKQLDQGLKGALAVPKLTGSMEPASLSKLIVTELLRKELGFQGLS